MWSPFSSNHVQISPFYTSHGLFTRWIGEIKAVWRQNMTAFFFFCFFKNKKKAILSVNANEMSKKRIMLVFPCLDRWNVWGAKTEEESLPPPPTAALFPWCGFHVYFALEKIPPLLCDYSHRAVRLTVIYIANRILNWGQVEAYLLPHNSDLSVGGFKTAERQSETAGSGSAPLGLGHINLAEDKESEEVVTARSWILPPLRPLPDSVTESFFFLCPVLSPGLWLGPITCQVMVRVTPPPPTTAP